MIRAKAQVSIRDSNRLVKDILARSKKAQKIAGELTIGQIRDDISRSQLIAKSILFSVYSHPVFRAIMGENAGSEDGSDLQAEFGLTPQDSTGFSNDLTRLVKLGKNIQISPARVFQNSKSSTKANVEVSIYNELFEFELISLDSASYTSSKGYNIPWLQWTFFKFDDVDPDYNIIYASDGNIKGSRSGRALMAKTSGRWDLPDFVKATDGNWLEEAITRSLPNVQKSIETTIRKILKLKLTESLKKSGFR